MKKITYVGLERCDFVYHLANILSLQGSVLVTDNSYSLDLIDAVSIDGSRDMREWRNIVYAPDVDLDETDVDDFDYVINYVGMAFKPSDFKNNDYTLIMPDYTKMSLKALTENTPEDVSNPIYIMRDACTKKFSLKSIAQYLDVNPKVITGWINLNTQDVGSYVALTHNHISNISSVTDEMLDALSFVSAKILDIEDNRKMMDKFIKAATKIK